MKRRWKVHSDGTTLSQVNFVRSLWNKCYEYIGIVQNDKTMEGETREKVIKGNKKKIKVFVTKLNEENIIKSINTWAIPVLRYSTPFLIWTKAEVQNLDR